MKIAVMSPWNAVCGVSLHTELIVRELVLKKHEITVFAHDGSHYINGKIIGEDEPYVIRNFSIPLWRGYEYFDPEPVLKTDFELFIVEHLSIMPRAGLLKIFNSNIKKRAKTVLIIHEFYLPMNPIFYRFKWDAFICFDQRYQKFLSYVYPPEKIHIFPYPCHPLITGDKDKARLDLDLPRHKKIILVFGFRLKNYIAILPALLGMCLKHDALILVVTEDIISQEIFRIAKKMHNSVEIRNETPATEKLYRYLHAADALVLYKATFLGFIKSFILTLLKSFLARKDKANYQNMLLHLRLLFGILKNKKILFDLILSLPKILLNRIEPVVVSSSVYQCLGSGCPILISRGRYTTTLDGEVRMFSNVIQLEQELIKIFEKRESFHLTQRLAKEYVQKHSPSKVADSFIELLRNL